jgi:hypothetical protein
MTCGGLEGQDACHTGANKHYDKDAKHQAAQLDRFGDPVTGYCDRAGCHASGDVRSLHPNTRCSTSGCHVEGGPTYMTCGGLEGQDACHTGANKHYDKDAKHQATELDPAGAASPGACESSGCHTTIDVRALHSTTYCSTSGCHVTGGPTYMSCGGAAGGPSCHFSYSAAEHFVGHSADMSGTVGGIYYSLGENVGCFGCHAADLRVEHTVHLGTMEGGGANACRVCHYDSADPGNNAYAGLPAITASVASGDRRCVACHANAAGIDGGSAVAGPTGACTATAPPPLITTVSGEEIPRIEIEALRSVPLTHGVTAPISEGGGFGRSQAPVGLTPEPSAENSRSADATSSTEPDEPSDAGAQADVPEPEDPAPPADEQPDAEQHDEGDEVASTEEPETESVCPRLDDSIPSTTHVPVPQSERDTTICLRCHVVEER